MTSYTFSRFAYFDTNIISEIAKQPTLWPRLGVFLEKNDLTIGLSTGQIAELADATELHSSLVSLFFSVPTAFLKTWDEIIKEEVEAHPQKRTQSLLMYPVNAMWLEKDGIEKLYAFFTSSELVDARQGQLACARQMGARHAELKSNFPPSKSGKYVRRQSDEFADIEVMQWLAICNRRFLEEVCTEIGAFRPELFLSVRLYSHVIFYKYYLGNRKPIKLSDFGDLSHLFYLPYCELAVMERDLCNILNQIQRNHDILGNTALRNIDFLSQWDWP